MKAVITGISGQDGAYLANELLLEGFQVIGTTRNLHSRPIGLEYLKIKNEIHFVNIQLENKIEVEIFLKKYKPEFIFHLAAVSSVSYSFKNPEETIFFNLKSTLNLLEAIRLFSPSTRLYQAASSEMFGYSNSLPIKEDTLHNPKSPYAVSKSACYNLVKNYRESYGIYASSGILFNHESVLRRDGFFIKKLIKSCLDIINGKVNEIKFGNLEVKRDFGFAPDYVKAMIQMMKIDNPDDFIICSGEAVCLEDIVIHLFNYLNIDLDKIKVDKELYRPSEIPIIYGDNSRAKQELKWEYSRNFKDVVINIFNEYQNNIDRL